MISEKQLLANRRNAVKSTGPRTEEGKARSRVNAARHGLAGAGIALPEGDRDKYARRLGKWSEQLGPRDDVEAYLVQSAALASVRLDRCMNGELALVDGKRCETIASWEQAQEVKRQAIIHEAQGQLHEALPELMAFSTGCEWLMFEWEIFRNDLLAHGYLSQNSLTGTENLHSFGDFDEIKPLNERARAGGAGAEQAREELAQIIEAELDQLEALRDELWIEKEAPLVRQVLEEEGFDASPRAALMRRYETSCRNDLHRSLRDLARIRKDDILHSHVSQPASAPVPQADPAPQPSPEPALRNEAISAQRINANLNLQTTSDTHPAAPSGLIGAVQARQQRRLGRHDRPSATSVRQPAVSGA